MGSTGRSASASAGPGSQPRRRERSCASDARRRRPSAQKLRARPLARSLAGNLCAPAAQERPGSEATPPRRSRPTPRSPAPPGPRPLAGATQMERNCSALPPGPVGGSRASSLSGWNTAVTAPAAWVTLPPAGVGHKYPFALHRD